MTKYCNICGRSYQDNTPLGTMSCPYNHATLTSKSTFTKKSSTSYSSTSPSSYSGGSYSVDGSFALGFILTLFLPLIGLIYGIAVKSSKPRTFKGSMVALAILGVLIIIGIIMAVATFFMGIWNFEMFNEYYGEWMNQ